MISFEEREKLHKVSIYTAEDGEGINLPEFSYSRYVHFQIDKTGIDLKHASFSSIAYNAFVQHHGSGTFLLDSGFNCPFGILEFNVQDKSGDRFFVALAGPGQPTTAAFVDTIQPRETIKGVFDS